MKKEEFCEFIETLKDNFDKDNDYLIPLLDVTSHKLGDKDKFLHCWIFECNFGEKPCGDIWIKKPENLYVYLRYKILLENNTGEKRKCRKPEDFRCNKIHGGTCRDLGCEYWY